MLLFEILGGEDNDAYQKFEAENVQRLYAFLNSAIDAAISTKTPFLSQTLIKAFNAHAIAALHINTGEYRVCGVTVGSYIPPEHYRVNALMDDFVNTVNRYWETTDTITLAAYVLWKLNHIHPFINGNGRTARAASYFVLCMKLGGWLPGKPILPELLTQDREKYLACLREVDESSKTGSIDFSSLIELISELLEKQLQDFPTQK